MHVTVGFNAGQRCYHYIVFQYIDVRFFEDVVENQMVVKRGSDEIRYRRRLHHMV